MGLFAFQRKEISVPESVRCLEKDQAVIERPLFLFSWPCHCMHSHPSALSPGCPAEAEAELTCHQVPEVMLLGSWPGLF